MHGRSTTGVTVVMLGLLSWLMAPSVAIAKGVPPFSVDIEVRHGHAQVHELVRVVVRLWRDAEHSQPRRAWPQFRGSLWAYPAEAGGIVDRAHGVKLVPERRGPYRMVDSFRPDVPGRWVVIPWGRPSRLPGLRIPTPSRLETRGWAGPQYFTVDAGSADPPVAGTRVIEAETRTPMLVVIPVLLGASLAVGRVLVRRRGPS